MQQPWWGGGGGGRVGQATGLGSTESGSVTIALTIIDRPSGVETNVVLL